jgi:8-oxo-dGTP pyrophosphatase MutT (NUDIX family)
VLPPVPEADPPAPDRRATEAPAPWRQLERREVYRNPWLRLEEHVVALPNGHETLYGVVRCRECVGMLPFVDAHDVLLVSQWRYVIGRATWEIPTGALHPGEAPEAGAQRELAEEVGRRAGRLLRLTGFDSSKSILEEHAHLYCCFDLEPAEATPDATELLVVRQVPFDEALALVLSGEIVDAMSVIAILWSDRLRRTGPWPPEPMSSSG